jgi:hypothetical protein
MEQEQVISDRFTIDVFYLETIEREAEPRAQQIVSILQQKYPQYQIRKRKLPRNINAQPGYRVSGNEIRFEIDEGQIAVEIKALIDGVFPREKPILHKITYSTPHYISVFVRNM